MPAAGVQYAPPPTMYPAENFIATKNLKIKTF